MRTIGLALLCAGAMCACDDRTNDWDVLPEDPTVSGQGLAATVGLTGSVAVFDPSLDRALMLTVPTGHELETTVIGLGKNPAVWQASPDRGRLFVLSAGVDTPQENIEPTLTVIDGSSRPSVCHRFPLDVPHTELVIDPRSEWVVVHDADAYVVNTSELILAELRSPDQSCHSLTAAQRAGEVINKTLTSPLGDVPTRMSFTDALTFSDGSRRTLLVERAESVQLVDLDALTADPDQVPISIGMREVANSVRGTPAETVYFPGGTETIPLAWLAVRMQNQSEVLLVEFLPGAWTADEPPPVNLNLVDVGGVPSDIEWVQTDQGLRLAAVLPLQQQAVLVDPFTTVSNELDLPAAYDQMSIVTRDITGTGDVARNDVALLWTEYEPRVAFWDLDETGSRLFASLEVHNTGISMSQVLEVTREEDGVHRHLRVLRGHGANEFRLLDLAARSDNQLDVTGDANFKLVVSPDAARVWVYPPNAARVVSPATLPEGHSEDLFTERNVEAVHDIARVGDGRAALMMHVQHGGLYSVGTTVFDAVEPRSTDTRFYGNLLLGGLR